MSYLTCPKPYTISPNQAWSRLLAIILSLVLGWPTISQAASPAIEATLTLPRTEPHHYVEAALALNDLGAPTEAASVADEFAALDLSDEKLAALVEKVGSAKLIRLGRELPAAAQVTAQALAAADAAAHAPERLAELVDRLGGDREAAIRAIQALRRTGSIGVDYCLEQIAESQDAKQRARLREALVALDPISLPALFEATGSENENVRVEALYALGRLAEIDRLNTPIAGALVTGEALLQGPAGDAARWANQQINGGALSVATAKSRLDAAINELLRGPVLFSGLTEIDPGYTTRLAARLAKDRLRIDPGDRRAERQAAMLAWESGAKPTATHPTSFLNQVLGEALQLKLYTAATQACEQLGESDDLGALAASGSSVSPLAAALEAPHPTTRFAAVEAITRINPRSAFAGSSRVADALLHFASATGDQAAVVAYPQLAKAGQTAGWLLGSGYSATPTNRGSEAVRVATGSPDTQLVLIDMSTSLPGAREILFRLRRSPATALVPVVVLAQDGRLSEAQRIADDHGTTVIAVARPHSAEATASLAERLVAQLPSGWPTSEERLARAEAARTAIAELIKQGPGFYGFDRRRDEVMAVLGAGDKESSLTTLVGLGTPDSQVRLLEAATFEVRSIEDRLAAAEAFAKSVDQHGVLLTSDQIRLQYDRYNASETAPEATQKVLGSLLDTLEGARE